MAAPLLPPAVVIALWMLETTEELPLMAAEAPQAVPKLAASRDAEVDGMPENEAEITLLMLEACTVALAPMDAI